MLTSSCHISDANQCNLKLFHLRSDSSQRFLVYLLSFYQLTYQHSAATFLQLCCTWKWSTQISIFYFVKTDECVALTQSDAAVLQQVAQMVKHGALVLSADSAEVAQEAAAVGHHLGEAYFLWNKMQTRLPGE